MNQKVDYDRMIHVIVEALASGLQESMDAAGANNYAAFRLGIEEGKQYLAMFVKLPNGKTPMELEAEAKETIARMRNRAGGALYDDGSGNVMGQMIAALKDIEMGCPVIDTPSIEG